MNTNSLATALRNKAAELRNVDVTTAQKDQTLRDVAELIRVLARVVEGKPISKAFGAPGDWGYETPLGAALAEPADIPELGTPVAAQAEGCVTALRYIAWEAAGYMDCVHAAKRAIGEMGALPPPPKAQPTDAGG